MFKRFVVSGTKKDNILAGTEDLDVLWGNKGNDVLDGRGGWDFLFGGKGNDKLFGGDGNDWLFGGKGKDELFGGDGDDKLFGGKGSDFLDGGAGSDYLFGDKGNDTFNFTLSENGDAKDYYDGGKGLDTLRLTLTSAEYDAAKAEIDEFEALLADGGKDFDFESFGLKVRNFEKLEVVTVGGENTAPVAQSASLELNEDNPISFNLVATDEDGDALTVAIVTGPTEGTLTLNDDGSYTYAPSDDFFGDDSFTFKANDGSADSNVATISLAINPVNDLPMAGNDVITESAVSNLIRVAVIGAAGGTYLDAVGQLNDGGNFAAKDILFTNDPLRDWTTELEGFKAVVLGEGGGGSDFTGGTGLFAALRTFVDGGRGVVTTGWFAKALENLDTFTGGQVALDADYITPIAPDGHNYSSNRLQADGTRLDDTITATALGATHEITSGILPFHSGHQWGWVLADQLDDGVGALAEGIAGDPDQSSAPGQENEFGLPLPAIAADQVGTEGGRTAYLGGMYMAESVYTTAATRAGDQDLLFERAVAWAAGAQLGGPAATVKIDAAQLLFNDSDVETASIQLMIGAVSSTSIVGGRDIDFDADTGEIFLNLSAQDVAQLELAEPVPIIDKFEYTLVDADGGTATAFVDVTVDALL
jgi:VCBS repeat-containing protein